MYSWQLTRSGCDERGLRRREKCPRKKERKDEKMGERDHGSVMQRVLVFRSCAIEDKNRNREKRGALQAARASVRHARACRNGSNRFKRSNFKRVSCAPFYNFPTLS